MKIRNILLTLVTIGVVCSPLIAQQESLKKYFIAQLNTLLQNTDAVVGVAIRDVVSGETIGMNEDEIFPQASSIKIHILTEVYRQAEQGKFKLSDLLPFKESIRVEGSGVLNLLGHGTVTMSIRDYAILMIVLSDNSATNLLIDLVGMQNVNRSLEAMGARKTKLQRVMMDIQAAKEGRENIGTPGEMMEILERMVKGTLISSQASQDMLAILKLDKIPEGPIRNGVPHEIIVANKEGEVEGMHSDVAVIFLPDHPYILCVMTKYLVEPQQGPKIISEISRLTYHYFERKANSNQFGRRIPR